MTSPADLEAPALARTLAPWLRRASDLIERKADDAHAHAAKAITDTLKSLPDGRPTLRKAGRSRSYAAASARLDELRDALIDLTRAARAAFYRDAFTAWARRVPAEYHVTADPRPTVKGTARFVAAVLHGAELRSEIAAPVAAARARLLQAVTLAGRRGAAAPQRADLLGAWRERTVRSLTAAARSALGDSQAAAGSQAGLDVIHPDLIDTTPVAVGE